MSIEEELEKFAEKRIESLVVRSKREEVRPASGEEVSDLRAEGDVVFDELAAGAQELTQGDDLRRWQLQALKAVAVGSESIGENKGVTAVILGTAHGVTVAEAVDLLGVDGENGDVALEKGLDHGAMRFFDGDGEHCGILLREFQEPIDGSGESLGTMSKASFSDKLCVGIDDACLVKPLA